jgi:hypothetical protein
MILSVAHPGADPGVPDLPGLSQAHQGIGGYAQGLGGFGLLEEFRHAYNLVHSALVTSRAGDGLRPARCGDCAASQSRATRPLGSECIAYQVRS